MVVSRLREAWRGRIPDQPKRSEWIGAVNSKAACSAPKLSNVISQAIFCVAGFMKAFPNQRLDPFLRSWSHKRINARIPPRSDFDIGRQTCCVDKALGIND